MSQEGNLSPCSDSYYFTQIKIDFCSNANQVIWPSTKFHVTATRRTQDGIIESGCQDFFEYTFAWLT